MPAKKFTRTLLLLIALTTPLVSKGQAALSKKQQAAAACLTPHLDIANPKQTLAAATVAQLLGWVEDKKLNRCGGYYREAAFNYSEKSAQKNLIESTSGKALFSQHGTSVLEGNIIVSQKGQEITANKGYLYRDPASGKISTVDLFGHVNLREPDSLIIANKAHLDLKNKRQKLDEIYYRTAVYSTTHSRPTTPNTENLQHTRKIVQLSAWGKASEFNKDEPGIYEFTKASYSTCPPNTNIWHIDASRIELNKNTGRGVATHAKLYIKKIPVFYAPYLNFPIDNRRQTGFLFPGFGSSNKFGPYVQTPFYWNMAPNYDTTITPLIMAKRGIQVNDLFRYLSPSSSGQLTLSVTPNDRAFKNLQSASQNKYQSIPDSVVQGNLHRLENASDARGSFAWQDHTRFNDHWSGNIDYNYVTDDYYLRDFGHDLNEVTENQLLQSADLNYKGQHWNFTTRVQQYLTLHPVDALTPTQNQYNRFPQLAFDGDYPDQALGLDYFVTNELTRFDIRNNPGSSTKTPVGKRVHTQPGISLPLSWPALYITPRAQMALTKYELGDVTNLMARNEGRALPILDVSTGMYFDRDFSLFGQDTRQTLEPQIYYLYVPYRKQDQIPLFDTTANTLTYDQLFVYNRFSGLDRIGDANQVSVGLTTRFIETSTGFERIRAGIAEIIYFQNRHVSICTVNNPDCLDHSAVRDNQLRRSPLVGVLNYQLNPKWSLTGNSIWNTQLNQMDNQSIALQYHPDVSRIVNLGYNFVRNGDVQSDTLPPNSNANNLKQIDVSFAWPVAQNWSAVGRWTKSVNEGHFQNLIYGIQYDSCCWAARFVGGRTFTNLDVITGTPQYDSQVYFQFALRGLGNFGSGDPTQYVSSNIGGYNTNFGQDF
jgi:LPS-assembly protein